MQNKLIIEDKKSVDVGNEKFDEDEGPEDNVECASIVSKAHGRVRC